MRKSREMQFLWILRLAWLILPLTTGQTLLAALDDAGSTLRITAFVLGFIAWGVGCLALLIPHPIGLTAIRLNAPVVAIGSVVASLVGTQQAIGYVGLAVGLAAGVGALSGVVADACVNGVAYGDEKRFTLRAPLSFLLGPVPVFWLLTVGALNAGILLIAGGQVLLGLAAVACGSGCSVPALKAFHALTLRCAVFVPAGMTLIDHLSFADPVLLAKRNLAQLGPALQGTAAIDFTQNAPGLRLEGAMKTPVEIAERIDGSNSELRMVSSLLFVPTRPGAVLQEAAIRGFGSLASHSTASQS